MAVESVTPSRIFTVKGTGLPSAIPATSRASFLGERSNALPSPRRVASWIGHPQLRSTKRAPASAASLAARTPSSTVLVASWTPKQFSSEASTRSLRARPRAKAISETVTMPREEEEEEEELGEASAASSAQRRRKGSVPTRVRGARTSLEARIWAARLALASSCAWERVAVAKGSTEGGGEEEGGSSSSLAADIDIDIGAASRSERPTPHRRRRETAFCDCFSSARRGDRTLREEAANAVDIRIRF